MDNSLTPNFQNLDVLLSQGDLRDFVTNAPIGLHWVDADGFIKWANNAELNMLGYSSDEYFGHHISEFHAHQHKITDILSRLRSNETLRNYETELKCKDGSCKTVQISSNVYRKDDQFIHTRCFTVDVTQQKELAEELVNKEGRYVQLAENRDKALLQMTNSLQRLVDEKTSELQRKNEDLKKSEERYHRMIEEVEDYAIVLLDKDGVIQNWNKGAEKIKGYKENEIVGKSFTIFYLKEDRANGLPQSLLAQAKEKGKALHEGWRLRKDGSVFWGSIVITALHDESNNLLGFSKVTRDLTDRKKAEDKLIENERKLRFQNSELEQFTYAASHDMKEPLRKVYFYNNLVLEKSGHLLPPKSLDYLNRSIRATARMSKLIDDLLVYSTTNSIDENFEMQDLNKLLLEVIASNKDITEDQRVMFDADVLPNIRIIPFQIRQLFDNLVNNSVKYAHPDRPLKISIKSEIVKGGDIPLIGAKKEAEYLKLMINDNGIGFKQEYAKKIFEMFQRLDNNSAQRGSGIGLAICQKIVQNHNGLMIAEGKEGTGATFTVFLPMI